MTPNITRKDNSRIKSMRNGEDRFTKSKGSREKRIPDLNKKGYYNDEDYRYFGHPVRKNTQGLAVVMNANAIFLFIALGIAYFSIPELLFAINLIPGYAEFRSIWFWIFIVGTSISFSIIFIYHKWNMEYKPGSIGNKNTKDK